MKDHPRKFELDNNLYERPNDRWLCGARAKGLPCASGPDARGRCGAVCEPIQEGDRFYCASATKHSGNCDVGPNSDGSCCSLPPQCVPKKALSPTTGEKVWVSNRGSCPRGPLPSGECCRKLEQCRPVKSVMARRKSASVAAFAVAVGLVMIMISWPGPNKPISPGDLSESHASMISNCSHCHDHKHSKLMASLFPPVDDADIAEHSNVGLAGGGQSARCLSCHQEFKNHGLDMHNSHPLTMAHKTEKHIESVKSRGGNIPNRYESFDPVLAESRYATDKTRGCATCHQEHRGADFDLKVMTNNQCQSCHVDQFQSFSTDHPPFSEYPHVRRGRIYFDHATHFGRHFKTRPPEGWLDEELPEGIDPTSDRALSQNCKSCHEPSSYGQMKTKSYEQSCAECHDEQISDPTSTLTFLSVPNWMFSQDDDDVIRKLQQINAPDDWGFSPMVMLMLKSDAEFQSALSVLSEQLDLIATDSDTTIDSLVDGPVVDIRSSVASALDQLSQVGDPSSDSADPDSEDGSSPEPNQYQLMKAVFGAQVSDARLRSFLASLPREFFEEFSDTIAGQAEASAAPDFELNLPDRSAQNSSWIIRGDALRYTLSYAPQRHADDTLVRLLELLSSDPQYFEHDAGGTDAREAAVRNLLGDSIVHSTAPGRCTKCHTVDVLDDRIGYINWYANAHTPTTHRNFERFSHLPHLTRQVHCVYCHKLDQESTWTYRDPVFVDLETGLPEIAFDEPKFTLGVMPIQIDSCVDCHNSERDSQSCTTCHNYHVLNHRD